MPPARDVIATRSALLELRDEQRFTREGHELLDQKRMLLAGEILRWLARYEDLGRRLFEARRAARKALAESVALHGVLELGVHPAGRFELESLGIERQRFLGVPIAQIRGAASAVPPDWNGANPSPEARRCRERHAELVAVAIEASVVHGNLSRLLAEFRRTERRARALEEVVLPELELTVDSVEDKLDEQDHEEAARLRQRAR